MRIMGQHSEALTISEVAEHADIAPASARRLLHTLVGLGYAQLDGRRFKLTPRVLELGFGYLSSLPLRDLALPLIDDFARKSGEVCTLSVLDRSEVVYVARAEVRSPLTRTMGVGERVPAHATSSGHVLLAGADEQTLQAFLAQAPFPALTPKTPCTRQAQLEAIRSAQKQQWSLAMEELELGVCGLAVPVCDRRGRTIAALTVSVNLARYTPATMLERFLPMLQDISRQLRTVP